MIFFFYYFDTIKLLEIFGKFEIFRVRLFLLRFSLLELFQRYWNRFFFFIITTSLIKNFCWQFFFFVADYFDNYLFENFRIFSTFSFWIKSAKKLFLALILKREKSFVRLLIFACSVDTLKTHIIHVTNIICFNTVRVNYNLTTYNPDRWSIPYENIISDRFVPTQTKNVTFSKNRYCCHARLRILQKICDNVTGYDDDDDDRSWIVNRKGESRHGQRWIRWQSTFSTFYFENIHALLFHALFTFSTRKKEKRARKC